MCHKVFSCLLILDEENFVALASFTMKQLEINSDKYTTLAVGMLLVFVFWSLVRRARDLFYFTYHPEPRTWSNYLISGFFMYVLLGSAGDRKLWREYPYGSAGFAFFLAHFVLSMALPKNASGTAVMILGFMGLAAALLVILEIALWWRTRVKVVSGDGKDAIFSQSEAKQFLVELIAREAQVAGEALSDVERRLLLFSADEPASGQGIPEERLFQDDSDFEARRSELLNSAYKSADADERRKIAEAIREVNKRDHYIAVIAQPVANRTTRVRDIGLYVVIGLGVVALVIGYAIYVTG